MISFGAVKISVNEDSFLCPRETRTHHFPEIPHVKPGLDLFVGIPDVCERARCTARTFPYLGSPFVVLTFAF